MVWTMSKMKKSPAQLNKVAQQLKKKIESTKKKMKMLNHARFLPPNACNIRAPVGPGLYLAVQYKRNTCKKLKKACTNLKDALRALRNLSNARFFCISVFEGSRGTK